MIRNNADEFNEIDVQVSYLARMLEKPEQCKIGSTYQVAVDPWDDSCPASSLCRYRLGWPFPERIISLSIVAEMK